MLKILTDIEFLPYFPSVQGRILADASAVAEATKAQGFFTYLSTHMHFVSLVGIMSTYLLHFLFNVKS